MAIKIRAATGVEIYLNPDQVIMLMPNPNALGQTLAMWAGGLESFNMSMDDLAARLWPESAEEASRINLSI